MKDLHDLSTTTRVYGIRPPDDHWRRMKAVWDACTAAGILLPREVDDFFNGEDPDEAGVLINLGRHEAVRVWSPGGDSMQEGVEVELAALPPDVGIVRFVNSY